MGNKVENKPQTTPKIINMPYYETKTGYYSDTNPFNVGDTIIWKGLTLKEILVEELFNNRISRRS